MNASFFIFRLKTIKKDNSLSYWQTSKPKSKLSLIKEHILGYTLQPDSSMTLFSYTVVSFTNILISNMILPAHLSQHR